MATINGTSGNDRDGATLQGTNDADEIFGLEGEDWLEGLAGDDTLDGGAGDRDAAYYANDPAAIVGNLSTGVVTDGFGNTDTLVAIERIYGTEDYNDTLTGGGIDSLTLLGLGGNDSITSNNPGFFSNLIGGTGNDTLTNLDGGAFMEPGSGQDTVTGSADPDDYSIISYYFEAAAADQNAITGVTVTFTGGGGGTATDFAGDTDTFTDIDSARGTALDDLLVGDAGRQDLTGHQGNDTLDGGDGEDRVEYLRSNYLGVPLLGVSVDLSSGIATDPFGDIDTLLRIENVRGTDLADTLVGDAEDNVIEGEGGDDQLSGGGGDDYIEGNDGNDTIDGGDDDDDLRGNAGDDSLLGGDGRDDLRGGAGNDTLDGGAGDRDEATYRDAGGSVTGSLTTGIVSDGDGGTDTLLNIEELRGGDFNDTLTGAETGVSYIRGGGGDDVLTGNRTIDGFGTDLDGGAGNDTLISIGGDAFFQPDIGNDTITGSAGFDTISYFFSAGYAAQPATSGVTFAFTAEGAGSATDHEGGTDTFTGIERAEGTMLADMLTGAAGFQDFRGFGGDDTINGGADYDLIDYSANRGDFGGTTGAGVTVDLTAGSATDPYGDTDTLINIEGVRGTGFADDITGDGSGQRLEGRDGNDTINGAGGDDEVRGEGGDDSLLGGEGNDELRGGGGNDTLDGGVGDSDEASYRDAGSGVSIDLTTGTANDGEGGTDTLVNIEAAEGSEFDDTIIGAMDEYSFLRGRGGDDSITGADDDQSVEIFGGAGDDTLTGGTGGAYFQGGTGDDLIVGGTVAEGFYLLSYFWDLDADYSASGISVTYTSDRAGTVADESGGTDTFSGIDRIEGTRNNDSFVGTTGFQDIRLHGGDDTVDGGADDDRVDYSRTREDFGPVSGVVVDLAAGMAIDPYGGTDTLMNIEQVRGTDFADSIVGDSADNSLQARDGDDTLSGGAGNDYLEGGSGADTFIVSSGHEEVYIADFEIGIDRLDLTGFARADALAAFNNAQAGSAILTFGDGTVLTVDGDNVSPATLSLDDIDLASDNSAPTGAVVISGNAEIGGTLTADISSLADPDIIRTDTITYQWQRDGSDISGSQAQNATYEVISDDLFTEISVVVSYTDEGDTDEQAISSTIIPLPMDLSIDGDETSEPLDGGPGNDTINGGGGEDTITGSRGDDQIDGGTGSDTAAYSGAKAAHTVSVSASGIAVEDRRSDGDGTDQLTSIESLSFLDGDWPLDIFDNVADLTEQAFRDFIEVYIAYFNRSPDAEGLFFYGTAFANGTSLEDSAATFLNSAEYQATYPPGLSNQEFAEAVYNNVLGRIPDVLGLEFWVGVLNSGARSRDVFILEVLKGAKAPAPDDATQDFIDQKAADVAYLANKTDIGLYFAVTKGMSNVTNATTAMQLFDDGDQSDIDAAVAAIDGFYADALDPTNGEFLLQLVGVVDDPFLI